MGLSVRFRIGWIFLGLIKKKDPLRKGHVVVSMLFKILSKIAYYLSSPMDPSLFFSNNGNKSKKL